MSRYGGHPLGSTAAVMALSDWERRTALASPDWDVDDEADEDEEVEW